MSSRFEKAFEYNWDEDWEQLKAEWTERSKKMDEAVANKLLTYMDNLSMNEIKTAVISSKMLESSFDMEKCIGFIKS